MESNVRCTMYLSNLEQENEEAITTCHGIRGHLKLLYSSTLHVTQEDVLTGSNEKTPPPIQNTELLTIIKRNGVTVV